MIDVIRRRALRGPG